MGFPHLFVRLPQGTVDCQVDCPLETWRQKNHLRPASWVFCPIGELYMVIV